MFTVFDGRLGDIEDTGGMQVWCTHYGDSENVMHHMLWSCCGDSLNEASQEIVFMCHCTLM